MDWDESYHSKSECYYPLDDQSLLDCEKSTGNITCNNNEAKAELCLIQG